MQILGRIRNILKNPHLKTAILMIVVFFISTEVGAGSSVYMVGEASWYSVASCKREGTWAKYGGRMANGEVFDDEEMVCASWDFSFGTLLRVVNLANQKSIVVRVADRGPAKRLYKQGRIIDLSKGAFRQIASLKRGIIKVQIERIN